MVRHYYCNHDGAGLLAALLTLWMTHTGAGCSWGTAAHGRDGPTLEQGKNVRNPTPEEEGAAEHLKNWPFLSPCATVGKQVENSEMKLSPVRRVGWTKCILRLHLTSYPYSVFAQDGSRSLGLHFLLLSSCEGSDRGVLGACGLQAGSTPYNWTTELLHPGGRKGKCIAAVSSHRTGSLPEVKTLFM